MRVQPMLRKEQGAQIVSCNIQKELVTIFCVRMLWTRIWQLTCRHGRELPILHHGNQHKTDLVKEETI